MYKVVLIDDEPLILEGLLSMINWNEYGFKVAGIANNGEEGLSLIEAQRPDLVFTDIRMPGLDGLKMIEACFQNMDYTIRFVILSGYNDFNYIKKALSLKSLTYLLKPVDCDEVHELLKSVKGQIQQTEEEIQKINNDVAYVLKTSIRRLIQGETKESLLRRIEFILDASKEFDYQIIFIEATSLDLEAEQLFYELNDFQQTNGAFLDNQRLKWRCISWHHSLVECLIYSEHLTEIDTKTIIDQIFLYYAEGDVRPRAFAGGIAPCLQLLPQSFEEAMICYKGGFYLEEGYVRFQQAMNLKYTRDITFIDIKTLKSMLMLGSQCESDYYVQQLFNEIKNKMVEPVLLREYFRPLLKEFQSDLPENYALVTWSKLKKLIRQASSYKSFVSEDAGEIDFVDQVKAYVNLHYQEDIKLKNIAHQIHFNVVYFGQLFRKKEGIKYNDYVLALRLEKAKDFLMKTDMSVKEISDKVGFNNSDYFSMKFKEAEGVSPSVYRTYS